MNDPWAFGWTQVLTIIGFLITLGIAVGGFRTFGRWKREKIEERRIEIALEALSIAYEAEGVFEYIRSPGAFGYETDDMPRSEGETNEDYKYRKTYYVPLKRIDNQKEFFLQVLKLKPRFMAVFGPKTQKLFEDLHRARVHIQVSAQALMRRQYPEGEWNEERPRLRTRMEADIWVGYEDVYTPEDLPEGDRVKRLVEAFRDGIVRQCRPVVDREFKVEPQAKKPVEGPS
jgi:hypothetical protein